MRIKTGRKAAAILAVMALAIAACGDGDVDAPDDTDDTTEETEEEEPDAPDETDEEDAEAAETDPDVLNLGYILPETGQLAFLGPPMISGVELAVDEINQAGGVLGNDIDLQSGDEAGDSGIAAESASRLLASGVDAIVGAAATGMTLAIIDQITGAGVVQCSPSNTGPGLTDYPDDGFYFRTAPTDALQGPVLGERIIADGNESVAIAARADDYGQGLLEATAGSIEAQGGTVAWSETYDPELSTFDSVVEDMINSGADAYVLIAFAEGASIVQGLIGAGIDPGAMYGADGIAGAAFAEEVDPGDPNVLDGMTFTTPSSQSTSAFDEKLTEFAPDLEDRLFAAQAYDCVNIIALSAAAAGSTESSAIQSEMIAVTNGDNACGTFVECAEFLDAGETIAYQSAAGDSLEFTEAGEPSRGTYDVSEWIDGEFTTVDTVTGTVD